MKRGMRIRLAMALALTGVLAGCARQAPGDPRITAHRGASGLAPENTLSAMVRAFEEGAGRAELDVQLTADGVLVLMHDGTLVRTAGAEEQVCELTLAQLQELEAGAWFDDEFAGEPIPTLEQVIRWARGRLVLNVEVKVSRPSPEIAARVVELIVSERADSFCFITSFDRGTVEEVKRLAPGLRTGLIFGSDYPADVLSASWEIVSAHHGIVDSTFVARAHRAGKEVHVWTVNDPGRMRDLLRLGVDSIITNRPDILRQVLSEES